MKILTRKRKSWLVYFVGSLLLLAQFALAAQACVPVPVVIAPSQNAAEEQGCDGMPADRGACLAHCLAQDQPAASLDQHFYAVPASAAVASAAFVLPVAQLLGPLACETQLRSLPSLQILYCSYQT